MVVALVVMACVEMACLAMACVVIAYVVMAYVVMAYAVMAYVVMAYVVMACVIMAYVVMAYIVMAYAVVVAPAPCPRSSIGSISPLTRLHTCRPTYAHVRIRTCPCTCRDACTRRSYTSGGPMGDSCRGHKRIGHGYVFGPARAAASSQGRRCLLAAAQAAASCTIVSIGQEGIHTSTLMSVRMVTSASLCNRLEGYRAPCTRLEGCANVMGAAMHMSAHMGAQTCMIASAHTRMYGMYACLTYAW